jgi:uncharacterized membrane protein
MKLGILTMDRLEHSIDITAPNSVCYERWHEFERFPTFMKNIKKVTRLDNNQWRWTVEAPLGQELSWNSQITSDQRDYSLSWVTLPPKTVDMRGTIRFDALSPDTTSLTVAMDYNIIAGGVMEALAHITHIASQMVEEDLENFKNWVEGNHIQGTPVIAAPNTFDPLNSFGQTPISTSF